MICILYVTMITALLGVATLLYERTLPPGTPRRWLWCISMLLTVMIPPVYRVQHRATIGAVSPDAGFWAQLESWAPLVMQLWQVASVSLILWGLFSALRVARILRRSREASREQVIDGVPVIVTRAAGPATVGLWRTHIIVPQWVLGLPRAQREYIVRHEEEHCRAHDGRLLFAMSLLLVLTPWNIALWWQMRRLSLAIEMDCDDRVVSSLGNATIYGELLLRVAEAMSRGPRMQPNFLGGVGTLERRLRSLLAPEHLTRLQRLLLPALAIVVLFVVLAMPHPVLRAGNTDLSAHIHER